MPVTATPPLPVQQVLFTPGKITYTLKTPYVASTYISTVTITRAASGPSIGGIITPGSSSTQGGKANVQVDATNFDAIGKQSWSLPFDLIITYDSSTYAVSKVETQRAGATQPVAPAPG